MIAVITSVTYIRDSIPVIVTLSLNKSIRYNIPAFITNEKSPNVIIINGDKITFNIGLRIKLSKVSAAATIRKFSIVPLMTKLSISQPQIIKAIALEI